MTPTPAAPLFSHGRMFMTEAIVDLARQGKADILNCLDRHLTGDWGDATEMRQAMNGLAVAQQLGAILSRYRITPDIQIVILTTEDRSLTKLMLVSEFLDDLYD